MRAERPLLLSAATAMPPHAESSESDAAKRESPGSGEDAPSRPKPSDQEGAANEASGNAQARGDASKPSAFQRPEQTRTILSVQPDQPEIEEAANDGGAAEAESSAERVAAATPHKTEAASGGSAPPETPTTRLPARNEQEDFGRYQRVQLLSNAGGMGAVYTALDPFLERTVALKVVRPDLVARVRGGTEYLERFISEAQIGAQLEHPNILPVHEFGRFADGRVYFTMKYIRGHTLREHLNAIREVVTGTGSSSSTALPVRALVRRSLRKASMSSEAHSLAEGKPRVPPSAILRRDLLDKFAKLCDAVAFSHSHGVIHRDIKPENVMIGEFGEVLLADWGLAKVLEEVPETARLTRSTATPPGAGASTAGEQSSRRVELDSSRLDTRELRRMAQRETQRLDAEARGEAEPESLHEHRAADGERLAEAIRLDFERLRREFGLDLSGNEPARTEAGMVMGTIGYMAPEQAGGERADHRADLFSLGCLLYEMVTLSPAFPQEGKIARLRATARAEVTPPNEVVSNPQALGDLVPILNRALEREPEERYPNASELAEDVQAVREWRGTQFSSWRTLLANTLRRNAPIVATAAIMLAGIVALTAYLSTRPAQVTFTSEPAGAVLHIDGKEYGPTPVEATIRPGNYELRFAKQGYHTAVQDFDVGPAFRGEASPVFLRSSRGYVHVSTEPAETRIRIRNAEHELVVDSRPADRETGYLWQQLPPGEYEVWCERPYYRDPGDWSPIRIRDGNETTVHNVVMRPTRGRAVISLQPPGTEVQLHPVKVELAQGEEVEPLRATVGESEWATPLLPAGTYRIEVLDSPQEGWLPLGKDESQIEVPGGEGVVTVALRVRSRLGSLRLDSPGVEALAATLIDAEGKRHRFQTENHRAELTGLPAGPVRIELRSDDHELTGQARETGYLSAEVVGGERGEVELATRPRIGLVTFQPDEEARGARLTMRRDADGTAAFEPRTLPAEGVRVRPGAYLAEARQELHYPYRFDMDVRLDETESAYVTLEPLFKDRRSGPSPGRLVPAGDLELYSVRGDLDGDGAGAILVRENDTLLVYSPMREEIVWPPIVMRELWDPRRDERTDERLIALAGDVTGQGGDDLVLGFGDQVLGYKAPSGELAFVRDARGRLNIRNLELVPRVDGPGKRIVVVTDRALVCYTGFSTDERWALELEPPASPRDQPRVLALPEPDQARYAGRILMSDQRHGTLVISPEGTLEQHLPGVQVHAVHGSRILYETNDTVRVSSVAALHGLDGRGALSGLKLAEGRVSAVAEQDGLLAVGLAAEDLGETGRLLLGLDAPYRMELPAAPVAIEPVRQGKGTGLLVVQLDNGGRAIVEPRAQQLLGVVAPHWIRGSSWRGLPGTGLAIDTTGDGGEELLWLQDGHLEIVSLERANLLRSYREPPRGVHAVQRANGDREWLIESSGWLEHLDASGSRLGRWPLDEDDVVRLSAAKEVVIEPEAFAGFDSAHRRELFAAEKMRTLEPLTTDEPLIGEYKLSERTGVVRVGPSGFVEQRLLSWPTELKKAWVAPGLGVITLDGEEVARLCAPPRREAREGALLLAWSVRQIRAERPHRVEPHLNALLEALPHSAHAHWVAGRLALARAEGASSAERETDYREEAMQHWEVAIEHNPNLIRARFDLANAIAERDRWNRADRRRIRNLLQPVFIARYRYARTVWLLLYEAVRSGDPERVSYYVEIFENTDAALDPEFMKLRDHRKNPRYHNVRLWILRFLE